MFLILSYFSVIALFIDLLLSGTI